MFLLCDVRFSEWIHTPSCLNVKELLARNRREIWSLSDRNWTWTQNHLVRKRTLNHLAKLVKWLSCVLTTYLSRAFDCMLLSCDLRVSEWIHTPSCLNVQELLVQSRLKIWSLSDCNWTRIQYHLVRKRTLNNSEHLSVRCIWLYVLAMSRRRIRVNLHSIAL